MFVDKASEVPQSWDKIAAYLADCGLHLDRDFEIRQFASGVANLNYLISVDGQKAVFRRPPNDDAPPGAYDFARQHKILSNLGKVLEIVPRSLAYCDDTSVIGVQFIVTEFRRGVVMKREIPEEMKSVDEVGDKLSRLLVDALVQVHNLVPGDVGLADLGKAEGFLLRQVHGWRKRGSRVMTDEQMVKVDAIRDWLLENLPEEQPGSIIHLDFKTDNVLIDPESMTVQGLIDWELSTIGDARFDLVLMLLGWGEPGDIPVYHELCAMPCDSPGWWTRRHALGEYCRQTGTSIADRDMKFFWILGMMRTFVAVAQLDALYKKEKMTNASALTEDMGAYVNNALDHAASLIDRDLDW